MSRPIWLGWKHVFARPFTFFFFQLDLGTGEIAQQLRASAILLEEPNSFSRTYLRWLTTTYNSSSRYPQSHAHTHAWAYACTYNNFKRLHLVFFFFFAPVRGTYLSSMEGAHFSHGMTLVVTLMFPVSERESDKPMLCYSFVFFFLTDG